MLYLDVCVPTTRGTPSPEGVIVGGGLCGSLASLWQQFCCVSPLTWWRNTHQVEAAALPEVRQEAVRPEAVRMALRVDQALRAVPRAATVPAASVQVGPIAPGAVTAPAEATSPARRRVPMVPVPTEPTITDQISRTRL